MLGYHVCYCQPEKFIVDNLFGNFTNNDTSANILFIVINNRNCARCFDMLCDYSTEQYKGYSKKYAIILMQKNLVSTLSLKTKYLTEIECLDDVYFYFTDQYDKKFLARIVESPTPQLILKTGQAYSYLSYEEVMKLIE